MIARTCRPNPTLSACSLKPGGREMNKHSIAASRTTSLSTMPTGQISRRAVFDEILLLEVVAAVARDGATREHKPDFVEFECHRISGDRLRASPVRRASEATRPYRKDDRPLVPLLHRERHGHGPLRAFFPPCFLAVNRAGVEEGENLLKAQAMAEPAPTPECVEFQHRPATATTSTCRVNGSDRVPVDLIDSRTSSPSALSSRYEEIERSSPRRPTALPQQRAPHRRRGNGSPACSAIPHRSSSAPPDRADDDQFHAECKPAKFAAPSRSYPYDEPAQQAR